MYLSARGRIPEYWQHVDSNTYTDAEQAQNRLEKLGSGHPVDLIIC
jgi:hypothetical protein